MADYKIYAQFNSNDGVLEPSVPYTVARYSNHSLVGLDQAEAGAQAAALTAPGAVAPTVSDNLGPSLDGSLTYAVPGTGYFKWNGAAWVAQANPANVATLSAALGHNDILHWFVFA